MDAHSCEPKDLAFFRYAGCRGSSRRGGSARGGGALGGFWRGLGGAFAFEIGLIPARAFELETGGGDEFLQRGLTTLRTFRECRVTHFLQGFQRVVTSRALVFINGHRVLWCLWLS